MQGLYMNTRMKGYISSIYHEGKIIFATDNVSAKLKGVKHRWCYDTHAIFKNINHQYKEREIVKLKCRPCAIAKVEAIRHFDEEFNIGVYYHVYLLESENGVQYNKHNLKEKDRYRWIKESDLEEC